LYSDRGSTAGAVEREKMNFFYFTKGNEKAGESIGEKDQCYNF